MIETRTQNEIGDALQNTDILTTPFPDTTATKKQGVSLDRIDCYANISTVAWLIALLVLSILTYEAFGMLLELFRMNPWLRVLMFINHTLLVTNAVVLVWRIWLVLRQYRSAAVPKWEDLPTVTVIIPAYNEGECVFSTITSVAESHYPEEKVAIIAVDDGSRDDTWFWMQKAKEALGERVQVIRCAQNRGKRHALYEGFLLSKGKIIITIDSDSVIESEALLHMVAPFQDPLVGAVAGNVRILNRREGVIPRMLDVSFTYSFDFIRASQSAVNTVMCTPGALSAYRRDILMQVVDAWINQTFLGRKANIGEDRAMTNLILQEGYHVHFQSKAIVYTNVPTSYVKLCKMFLRWARSNIRETIVMTRFIFRKFRSTGAKGARVNLVLHWSTLTLLQILRIQTIVCLMASPFIFGIHLLLGAAIISIIPALVYALKYKSTNSLWAFPYGLFWIVGLWWITPYALLTPHKNGWLTRDLPQNTPKNFIQRFLKPLRRTKRQAA